MSGWGNRRKRLIMYLTDENFEREIQLAEKPVLVDFFAFWCPACQVLSPILEELEKEFEETVIFYKVNVDMAPHVSQNFGINPIPTVILFKDGKEISRFIGVKSKEEIRKWIQENLKKNGRNN